MKYKYTDIGITSDGDLLIGPTDDLYVLRNLDAVKQGIEFRIKTDLGDMLIHPKLGNRLRDIAGKRNTREVADQGRASIIGCLTYGNFLDPKDINVVAIPMDANNILYHVEIDLGNYVAYKFDLVCDLENGIRRI